MLKNVVSDIELDAVINEDSTPTEVFDPKYETSSAWYGDILKSESIEPKKERV